MSIRVEVIRLPGRARTAVLSNGATVADALNDVGETISGKDSLKLSDGSTVNGRNSLQDGDKLIISKGAKGNL